MVAYSDGLGTGVAVIVGGRLADPPVVAVGVIVGVDNGGVGETLAWAVAVSFAAAVAETIAV